VSTAAPSLRHLTSPSSLLLLAAAGAWVGVVVVARHMGPMPGTMGVGLGTFVAVWALMMAAMMLPSVTPSRRSIPAPSPNDVDSAWPA